MRETACCGLNVVAGVFELCKARVEGSSADSDAEGDGIGAACVSNPGPVGSFVSALTSTYVGTRGVVVVSSSSLARPLVNANGTAVDDVIEVVESQLAMGSIDVGT